MSDVLDIEVRHAPMSGRPGADVRRPDRTFAGSRPTGEYGLALRRLAAAGDRMAAHLWLVMQDQLSTARSTSDRVAGAGPKPARPAESWRTALWHYLSGDPDEALHRLTMPVVATSTADGVQVNCFAAVCHLHCGDLELAAGTAEEAMRRASESGIPGAESAATRLAVLLAAAAGDESAAGGLLDRAERGNPGDNGLLRLMVGLDLAAHAVQFGAPRDALRHLEVVISLSSTTGHTSYDPYVLSLSAAAKCQLGRLEDALADSAASQRLAEAGQTPFDRPFALATLGTVHRRRREPRQARKPLEDSLAALADDGRRHVPLRTVILSELARVRAADDPHAARTCADRAVAIAGEIERLDALLARGWVALTCGDISQAQQDAAEARTAATVARRPTGLAQALALMVLASADPRACAGLLDDATELCSEGGDRAEAASIRLIAARLQRGRAHEEAERAEQELRRCGVRLDHGVADGLTAMTLRAPAIVIHTLGDFRVIRSGTGVPSGEWQSKKARDLLKILIAHRGRPVPRARLIDLLWPDGPPARTANRLSVLLSTLRRVLDAGPQTGQRSAVLANSSAVAIDLSVVDVDLESFLVAAKDAHAAQREGRPDAARLLTTADDIYEGDFLDDDPYQDWLQPLREELRAAHTAVLHALAQHTADRDQKLVYLTRLVHRDPYDEDSHIELIQVLRAAGRHGEAHRRYQAYAVRMRELGVRPAGGLVPERARALEHPAGQHARSSTPAPARLPAGTQQAAIAARPRLAPAPVAPGRPAAGR